MNFRGDIDRGASLVRARADARVEHCRSAAKHGLLGVPGSLMGGAIFVALASAASLRAALWLAALVVVQLVSLRNCIGMLRRTRPDGGGLGRAFDRRFTTTAVTFSAVWGLLPLVVPSADRSWEFWLLSTVFLLATSAGTVIAMGGLPKLFIGSTFAMWTPTLVMLGLHRTERHALLLVGALLVLAVLLSYNRYGHRVMGSLVELQVQNKALLAELHEGQRQLKAAVDYDLVTGQLSRRGFTERLELVLASGDASQRVCLVVIDLDGFKAINDTHGHAVGDALLGAVGQRLSTLLGPDVVLGRWGGDEFVAFQASETNALNGAVRGMSAALDRPFRLDDGIEVSISASIGVACGSGAHTVDALFLEADAAMYTDKATRRRKPAHPTQIATPAADPVPTESVPAS